MDQRYFRMEVDKTGLLPRWTVTDMRSNKIVAIGESVDEVRRQLVKLAVYAAANNAIGVKGCTTAN